MNHPTLVFLKTQASKEHKVLICWHQQSKTTSRKDYKASFIKSLQGVVNIALLPNFQLTNHKLKKNPSGFQVLNLQALASAKLAQVLLTLSMLFSDKYFFRICTSPASGLLKRHHAVFLTKTIQCIIRAQKYHHHHPAVKEVED